jgi:hypothetical protein
VGSSTVKGSVSVSYPPPAATTSAAPLPPTECPPTLPRCLKTWIFIIDCDDTADANCFCPHAEFVTKVSECVQSWGKDDSDVSKSLEYFLGICQPYIPQNPAIVSCLPPTITLPPPPANVPVTTVVQTIATVVPCPVTTITAGPSSGYVVSTTTTTKVQTATIPVVQLVVTAVDATLVYPTLPATTAPATYPPTGPGSTYVPAGPTTLVTGVAKNGTATATGLSPKGSGPTNIIVSPGAASGLFPATFAAAIGAVLVIAFQF